MANNVINEGIKGRLRDMSLADIVQVLHVGRRTAEVNLGCQDGAGRVYMDNGNVVHAKFREIAGENAFYHMLGWEDGEFEVEMDIKSDAATITKNIEPLLLEGMKRIDEARKNSVNKEALFRVGEKESLYLIERLIELNILKKKE